MTGTDRAVVVGITRYPGLEDLEGSENDANDFADWLQDPHGGAVPKDRITLILSSQFPVAQSTLDAQPTTEALVRAFAGLWDQGLEAGDGKLGRRLYIFMAGHGFAPDLKTAALLMANAARSRLGLHIPGPPYADRFRQAGFFDEVVLLMDCCRDNLPQAPVHEPPFTVTTSPALSRYFYGFATTFSRRSREEPDESGRVTGIFTRMVLAGLRGEAAQATGRVTGRSLVEYAYNVRAALGGTAQARQDPEFQLSQEAEIVWVEASAPTFTVRVSFTAAKAGTGVRLLDGVLAPIPPTSTTGDVMEWHGLAPGLYLVKPDVGQPQQLTLIGPERTVDVHV